MGIRKIHKFLQPWTILEELKGLNLRKNYFECEIPILTIASASADTSGDQSAAKYSEMSAILGFLGQVWPQYPSLWPPPPKKNNNKWIIMIKIIIIIKITIVIIIIHI